MSRYHLLHPASRRNLSTLMTCPSSLQASSYLKNPPIIYNRICNNKCNVKHTPSSTTTTRHNLSPRYYHANHYPRHDNRDAIQNRHHSSSSSSSDANTNVNPSEVSKFSSLSSTWWDSSRNPLIAMNSARVERLLRVMRSHRRRRQPTTSSLPLADLRILDVGCGGGILSSALSRLGGDVLAIDPSIDIVAVAKRRASFDERTRDVDFQVATVEDLAADRIAAGGGEEEESRASFDVICILDVIEHVPDPGRTIRAALSLLKRPGGEEEGGVLFVSTLNRTWKSFAIGIVGAEYVAGVLPVGTHDWERFLSPEEVEAMVKDGGRELGEEVGVIDVCGMVMRPHPLGYLKWGLDPNDTDVNWIGAYGFVGKVKEKEGV